MSLGLALTFFILATLLSAIGGLLAAADAAYSVSSRTDLEQLAERSPRRAAAILAIADDRAAHLGAVNFVRVVAESFSAVLITVALSALLPNLWVTLVVAAVVVAFVTFVLVSASPRSVGAHYPDQIIGFTARLIRALRVSLGPLSSGLLRMSARVSPGRNATPGRIRDEQQLLSMVDRAAEQELLEEEEQDLIHSVMEFGDTIVREVMVPRTDMVTVDAQATVAEALDVLLSSRHSRIPVTSGDSDEILGIAYLRDVTRFVYRKTDEADVASVTQIMKDAQFVPEVQPVDDLLRQMQRESNHLALAVDEYGGIAGLVTMEDLIEELVGEINDEHDRDTSEVTELGSGEYLVSARLGVEELGELFDIDLQDDEVESVGGLIAKHLGRLADEGDVVHVSGIELTVEQLERKRQRIIAARARWVGVPTGEDETAPRTGSLSLPRKESGAARHD